MVLARKTRFRSTMVELKALCVKLEKWNDLLIKVEILKCMSRVPKSFGNVADNDSSAFFNVSQRCNDLSLDIGVGRMEEKQ